MCPYLSIRSAPESIRSATSSLMTFLSEISLVVFNQFGDYFFRDGVTRLGVILEMPDHVPCGIEPGLNDRTYLPQNGPTVISFFFWNDFHFLEDAPTAMQITVDVHKYINV